MCSSSLWVSSTTTTCAASTHVTSQPTVACAHPCRRSTAGTMRTGSGVLCHDNPWDWSRFLNLEAQALKRVRFRCGRRFDLCLERCKSLGEPDRSELLPVCESHTKRLER